MNDLLLSITSPHAFTDALEEKLKMKLDEPKKSSSQSQSTDSVVIAPIRDVVEEIEITLSELLKRWKKGRESDDKVVESDKDSAPRRKRRFDPNSTDPFVQNLYQLDEQLDELKIWDVVLSEIADREDICPSSSLRGLLHKIRNFVNGFAGSIETVFAEIRHRLQFDWTLQELRKKRTKVFKASQQRLEELKVWFMSAIFSIREYPNVVYN